MSKEFDTALERRQATLAPDKEETAEVPSHGNMRPVRSRSPRRRPPSLAARFAVAGAGDKSERRGCLLQVKGDYEARNATRRQLRPSVLQVWRMGRFETTRAGSPGARRITPHFSGLLRRSTSIMSNAGESITLLTLNEQADENRGILVLNSTQGLRQRPATTQYFRYAGRPSLSRRNTWQAD